MTQTVNSDLTLREYIGNSSGGLWSRIRGLDPSSCPIPDAGLYTSERLDHYLITNYGQRIVRTSVATQSLDLIAGDIIMLYSEKWADLVKLSSTDYNIGGKVKRRTETATGDVEASRKSGTINKTSAFDSADMITDNGVETSDSESNKNNSSKTIEEADFDLADAVEHLSLKARNVIIAKMATDIVEYVTLNTY